MMRTVLLAAVAVAFSAPAWADPEAAMKKGNCLTCHTKDKKLVGPAFKDIAAKYKGQADAPAKLFDKVRKGGSGVWGPVPMAPNPASAISDADLKAAIEFILKS